jgi:putative flippase GtrA
LVMFVSWFSVHYLVANVISLLILTLVRFVISDRLIWKPKGVDSLEEVPLPSVQTEKL